MDDPSPPRARISSQEAKGSEVLEAEQLGDKEFSARHGIEG